MKTCHKQNLVLIQMGCDQRIPAGALGYVSDLGSASVTERIWQDRLQQLSRYVPDLVDDFRAAGVEAMMKMTFGV